MSRTALLAAVVASFLAMPQKPVLAEDWPTYLRNNQRHGASPEALKFPLKKSWEFISSAAPEKAWGVGPGDRVIEGKDLEHRVNFDDAFHVAVVGNSVFFGSSVDHQLRCIDATTGRERWHFFTGGPIRLAPTVADGRVFFGSDDGYVYCLNAADGSEVWKLRPGADDEWLVARGEMISKWPVRTGVLVDGDIAYFGAGLFPHENVYLYAVRAATGEVIWRRNNISQLDAGRNDLSPQGYLLCSDERLFVPSGRSLPGVFNKSDGQFVYKRGSNWRRDGVVGGTQALLADDQLYTYGAQVILALDQKRGGVGFGWFNGDQMAVDGDSAYISNGTALARLDRLKYAVNSRRRHKLEIDQKAKVSSLRSAKGDKKTKLQTELDAIQAELKEIENVGFVWKVDSTHESALVTTAGHVVTGGVGEVAAHTRDAGESMWVRTVEGNVRGLAVANGRLYVSTDAGRVICYASADAPGGVITEAGNVDPFPADQHTDTYARAAEQILKVGGIDEGFCLVVGSERGRLALELARRSKLRIYGVESDAAKVAESRSLLAQAGVYGNRITIHHADLNELRYSNYFANLVVSDTHLVTGRLPIAAERIARHVKPLGGRVVLGHLSGSPQATEARRWLAAMNLGEQAEVDTSKPDWTTLTRGALPGAGDWSHQYGGAGNTAASGDFRIKGGLGVLWYGDPGENKMVNRHEGAVGPLAVNGRLFIQGESTIMAYDSYNGRFLWEIDNPKSIRTGVFQNQNPGNLVATDDSLFYMVSEKCVQLDAATGKVVREHRLPEGSDDDEHQWGYVSYKNGRLFGTATRREELERRLRRRGRKTQDSTDVIFAIDVETGKHLWSYQGKTIAHHTIAIGEQRVFLIDSTITSEQRDEILRRDKEELRKLTGEARKLAEDRAKKADLRLAVAVDAATGNVAWTKPVDVTDCSDIGIGGGKLTLMTQDDVLILCGANANGHYWKQFLAGDFNRRRLVALAAEDGRKLWSKDANYRHRPIIVKDQVLAEPWQFDLYTGAQKMRPNPVTGELEPWSIMRSGHHCGMISASPNMLFFRAGYTGFYDLESDDGTQHFAGHRTGCWINMIPANGLLMIPESSAGCVCLFSIASTIVMEPREARRPWAIYSSTGDLTPVRHLCLNLAAPGDRRDARGRVWLSYPRPRPSRDTGLDLKMGIESTRLTGNADLAEDTHANSITNAEVDWVSSSGIRGLGKLSVPVLPAGSAPTKFRVRLHFTELNPSVNSGMRQFDVLAQGKTVLRDVDIARDAAGARTAIVREIPEVMATEKLTIELKPKATGPTTALPMISGIEIIRVE